MPLSANLSAAAAPSKFSRSSVKASPSTCPSDASAASLAPNVATPPQSAAEPSYPRISIESAGGGSRTGASVEGAPGQGDLASIREAHAAGERAELLEALRQTGGNVSAAARVLSLSRHQVVRRLAKYGLG